MAEQSYTAYAAFSRMILPTYLFSFPPDQEAMLLAGRYAKPVVQNWWREFCKEMNLPLEADADRIDVTSKFLFNTLASSIIKLPPPGRTGEAFLALFIIPARPEDGPRRYFTLEVGDSSSPIGTATLWELVPTSKTEYSPVERKIGVEQTAEAMAAAVEALIERERNEPARGSSWPGAAATSEPAFLTRFVVMRGDVAIAEPIPRAAIEDRGLSGCNSMLISIRAGAAEVIRARVATAQLQTVSFGIPASLFPQLPPGFDAVHRGYPGHLFTVSSEGKPLIITLVVPDSKDICFFSALREFVQIAGEPDPAKGDPVQQRDVTVRAIMDQRPAVVSILAAPPASEDDLADLLGFTQYLGAAVLLEKREPAAALASPAPTSVAPSAPPPNPTPTPQPARSQSKPGLVSRWMGKLFGK